MYPFKTLSVIIATSAMTAVTVHQTDKLPDWAKKNLQLSSAASPPDVLNSVKQIKKDELCKGWKGEQKKIEKM